VESITRDCNFSLRNCERSIHQIHRRPALLLSGQKRNPRWSEEFIAEEAFVLKNRGPRKFARYRCAWSLKSSEPKKAS
jgi:hypothetical protein